MARARMISPTIATDKQLRRLSCMGARFLYLSMIPHADNCGRLRGEPSYVRSLAIPYEPGVTDSDVEKWLVEMNEVGLVAWYDFDEAQFIQFALSSWGKHQDLKKYRPHSHLPDPPQSAAIRRIFPHEVEVEVEVEETLSAIGEHSGSLSQNVTQKRATRGRATRRRRGEPIREITEEQIESASARFHLPIGDVRLLAEKIRLEFDARGYTSAPSALLTWCKRESDRQPTNGAVEYVDPAVLITRRDVENA